MTMRTVDLRRSLGQPLQWCDHLWRILLNDQVHGLLLHWRLVDDSISRPGIYQLAEQADAEVHGIRIPFNLDEIIRKGLNRG